MNIPQATPSEQERHISAELDFSDLKHLSVHRGKPQPEVTRKTRSGKLITIG